MSRNTLRIALAAALGAMMVPLAACSSAKGEDESVDTTLPDEPTSSAPTEPAFAATEAAAEDAQAAASAAQAAAADFARSGADDAGVGNDEPPAEDDAADQSADKSRYN